MSWQATAWADSLPYDVAKPLAYRVLIKLSNVADQNGRNAFRLKFEMANELGVDPRSITRALKELRDDALILEGDQALLSHWRADRRPTVYDMNFNYTLETMQPELPPFPVADHDEPDEITPSEVDSHGVTEFSTPFYGVTHGVTTEVQQGTKGTTYLTLNKESLVPDRAQAPEIDASGASSPADADGSGSALPEMDGLSPETAESLADERADSNSRYEAAIHGTHKAATIPDYSLKASLARIPADNAILRAERAAAIDLEYAFTPCPKRTMMPCTYGPKGRCVDCDAPSTTIINPNTGEVA